MELDYMLANGKFVACNHRSEEFLNYCIEYNSSEDRHTKIDKEQIINSLNEGKDVKFGTDWHEFIRNSELAKIKNEKLKQAIEERMKNYVEEEDFDARMDEQ